MAIIPLFLPQLDTITLATVLAVLTVVGSLFAFLFSRPAFPKNAPPPTSEAYPVIGSLQFFTERWEFFKRCIDRSPTGNFTFYAGKHPVVGLAGEESRKVFFDSRELAFAEGYAALLAGGPPATEVKNPLAAAQGGGDEAASSEFSQYFSKRIIFLLKGPVLKRNLPNLLRDTRENLDMLAANPSGVTDPFDSIYHTVFQLTMRTVACNEIASNQALLDKCLAHYEAVDKASGKPLMIMYPWIPQWGHVQRTYGGASLYMIFKNVIDARKKEGRRETDALQYLLDEGDSLTDIITFVMGALFAGQLNSGINAAWILVYLASNPEWLARVKAEINAAADRYAPDASLPLKERLMYVPIEAWHDEFPMIDLCLRETIRIQIPGTAFRKNMSGHDIVVNKKNGEVIPNGAYAAYATGDVHYDPSVYPEPDKWDPSRYLPERAEDKKVPYAFMGWGLGRHPCLGMKFAKLENNVIVAFFLAYFDNLEVVDSKGRPYKTLPRPDLNMSSAQKPPSHARTYLKYTVVA